MPLLIEDKQTQNEMATLIHPDTGDREAVSAGSQDAQKLFGEGFVLEGSPNTPVAGATQATTGKVTTGNSLTAGGVFAETVQNKAIEKITEKRNELLNAPENYDTQILLQRGALFQALAEGATALTPDNLRWLTPQQQQAIRDGNQSLLKSAIGGLNSILQGRADLRKEEEARQEQEEAKRLAQMETAFSMYNTYNLWDKLSDEEKENVENTFNLPPGSVDSIIERSNAEGENTFTLRSSGSNLLELELDPSGRVVNQRIIASSSTGSRITPTSSDVDMNTGVLTREAFEEMWLDAAGQVMSFDPNNPAIKKEIDQAWSDYEQTFYDVIINGVRLKEEDAKKLLHTDDRRQMIDRGLDPNNLEDIKTYIENRPSGDDDGDIPLTELSF
jgi:hypothetical protein